MNLLRGVYLLVVIAGLASPALAKSGTEGDDDLSQMQGEWHMTSGTVDGMAMPEFMMENSRRVCKGDELTVNAGGQLIMKAKIMINATRKPKTIDYQVSEGAGKGKTRLGIYALTGDTLDSCFAAPDAARPTDFVSIPGDKCTSTVWKRVNQAAAVKPK